MRSIAFQWNDAARTLSWAVSGSYTDAQSFVSITAVAYFASGSKQGTTEAVGTEGAIRF